MHTISARVTGYFADWGRRIGYVEGLRICFGGGEERSMRDLEYAGKAWLASAQDRVCLSSLIVYFQLLPYNARARSHESMTDDLQIHCRTYSYCSP